MRFQVQPSCSLEVPSMCPIYIPLPPLPLLPPWCRWCRYERHQFTIRIKVHWIIDFHQCETSAFVRPQPCGAFGKVPIMMSCDSDLSSRHRCSGSLSQCWLGLHRALWPPARELAVKFKSQTVQILRSCTSRIIISTANPALACCHG